MGGKYREKPKTTDTFDTINSACAWKNTITAALCKRDEEWKRHNLDVEEAQEEAEMALKAYGNTFKMVLYFKYLWRVISDLYD